MTYRRKPRRGVLLLVVLSLLVLFVLVGITFVVVAGQYRRTTISAVRHERTGDAPEKLLTNAVMQLIRDTRNPESRVRDHSFLNDLYGGFTYYNYLNDANPLTVNEPIACRAEAIQFLEPNTSPNYYANAPQEDDYLFFKASAPLAGLSWSAVEDDYCGRVITFLEGPLAGSSTRVVKYWPNGPPWDSSLPTFAIEKPEREGASPSAQQITQNLSASIAAGNGGFAFVINGRPFDGLGAGVNPNDGTHVLVSGSVPLALLPFRPSGFSTGYHAGGLDESWDAPDPENMFLACMPSDPSSPNVVLPLIPSFHRPALLNYWRAQQGGSIADPLLLSQIMLRPNWLDNPTFTGSNPALDRQSASDDELLNRVIQGFWDLNSDGVKDANEPSAWDVDNDGDGIQESVWIDLGMPVQHVSDGRRYKPLFAFLVQDLDGRINLNAAGNIAQLNYDPVTRLPISDVDPATGNPFEYFDPSEGFRPADVSTSIAAGMTGTQQLLLPRGRGYSPAEINFIDSVGGDFSLYGQIIFGRYGANRAPGWLGINDGTSFWPDFTLSYARQPELLDVYPHSVPGEAPVTTAFNSRSDTYGRDAIYLDRFGHAHFAIQDSSDNDRLILEGEAVDDPLEINLVTENFYDQPFAANELEPILRWFDAGSTSTSSRLQAILGNLMLADSSSRQLFTARSFDVDALSFTRILQDFVDALQAGGAAAPTDESRRILPWELFRGQKLNLNRLFANGLDDNSNGVADEPLELEAGTDNTVFSGTQVAGSANYGNGIPSVSNALGRHLFARHLYSLMVYITANYPGFPINNGLEVVPPALQTEMKYRRLAQWAVNVVDFRDADAVMTPFEYDVNPFNGWNVDGIVGTADDSHPDRRLVWGCESPELILTEALAFHDRRVRDTSSGGSREPPDNDPTLDQYRIPEGSLFLELLCTGQPHASNPTPPRDLYGGGYNDPSVNSPVNLLDLERLAPPNVNSEQFPVWRVAISEPHLEGADSPLKTSFENPDTATFNPADLTLQPGVQDLPFDRYLWFAHHAPPASLGPEAKRVFYNRANMPARIPAGTLAVVGPRPITIIGSQPDPNDTGKTLPALQRITLNHTAGVVTHKIDNQTAETERRAVVIMAGADPPSTWPNLNRPVGVNISEPLPDADYYDEPDLQLTSYPTTDGYNTPPNQPFDTDAMHPDRPILADSLAKTGIYRNYRTAFLQRLADPTKPHDPLNPETNPYITVDWIPLDLSVFNGTEEPGETFEDDTGQEQPLDPNDPDAFGEDPPEQFTSRFRVDVEYWVPLPDVEDPQAPQPNLSPTNNIWAPESMPPAESIANANGVGDYFNHVLSQTLGILPDNYALVPWITWNNRPYNSAYELTLVPASAPERLLYEFSMSPTVGLDPYTDYNNPAIQRVEALPFGHLLNFFHDNLNTANTPGLYRLFDFVEVPSRFVGTERWFTEPLPFFQSPFNSLSRFREPGKINLNTIFDRRVWNAVAKNYPQQYSTDITNPSDFFNKFWRSRQGNGAGAFQMDSQYPTMFANPFRAASTSALRPPLASGAEWETGVQATVFRNDPDSSTRGLFTPDPMTTVNGNAVYGPYNDPVRNAYFKYDGVQRLGNLVTTHSNVFAVWITVGFFELDENGKLGPEMGSGTGQVKRHRGFYIIDRSIPVAFEPGMDHNVDKCIILRRFIE